MATNLYDITGQESGAIQYEDGFIWIGKWARIEGTPRTLLESLCTIDLGGDLVDAEPCKVPPSVIEAMREHELDNGDTVSEGGWYAWRVADVTIVINRGWN